MTALLAFHFTNPHELLDAKYLSYTYSVSVIVDSFVNKLYLDVTHR